MKKALTINLLKAFFLASQALYSLPVDQNKAQQAAYGFYISANPHSDKSIISIESVFTDKCEKNEHVYFYAVNFSDTGFVLIAGDDAISPVLGYSFSSFFTGKDIPIQLEGLLNEYRKLITHVRHEETTKHESVKEEWNKILNGETNKTLRSTVGPLIPCLWDQGQHYNMLCPEDTAGPGGRVFAGCVATAMSMLMFHFRYPDSGQGQHGYYSNYGYLHVDFTQSYYNWNEMPTRLISPNYPVAKLMYDAGVAVNMMYSPHGSGAFMDDAAFAMHTYFKYSPTMTIEYRNDYSFNDWTALLKSQIDQGYPLIYAGYVATFDYGHAFICDGYDSGNLFHFNWGWSGAYNGFYVMDYLTPGGYNFSTWQMAFINCIPDDPSYPAGCTGQTTITGSTGTITDGSGPEKYKNNSSCSWLIQPEILSQSVRLKFHRFDLQSPDQLCVYDGSNSSYPLLGCFSGNTLPPDISSNGESIFITFHSDTTINDKGFFIEYFSTPVEFCDSYTILTDPSGTIEDGSGLRNYQPNTFCRWLINPENAKAIVFDFKEFDIEPINDDLILLDNTTFPSTEIARFSGSTLPETFVYWGDRIILMFKTNNFIQQDGWKINYSTWMTSTEELISVYGGIYPNPFNEMIMIHGCSDGCEVKIFNVTGSLLKTISTRDENFEISTSDLSKGVYMVHLKNGEQISVHKLVKVQ